MNFLDRYNEELRHLRKSGAQFSKEHPQVAGALGLHPDAITDPFVERLLEGVAYLTARVQTRLDRQNVEFAEQALTRLSPLYASATPSIGTFAFHPDFSSPEAHRGKVIPKGAIVTAKLPGRQQPVQFTTARKVTLWPLKLSSVDCSRNLAGIPSALAKLLSSAHAILRLRFELEGSATVSALSGNGEAEPLHLSFAGDLPTAYALQRTLLVNTTAWFAVAPTVQGDQVVPLPLSGIGLAGITENEAVLPSNLGGFPGLRLLREYFSQPSKFLGIELDALATLARQHPKARSFDLIFALDQISTTLLGNVKPEQFRLFSSAAINLYPKRMDPVPYSAHKTEQWIPVDRMRPNDYHLWALTEMSVNYKSGKLQTALSVLDSGGYARHGSTARYSLKREGVTLAEGAKSGNADQLASHDTISLSVSEADFPLENVSTLLAKGLVADRNWRTQALPEAEFRLAEAGAVERIECLWSASAARSAPAVETCWEAVSLMGQNPLSLTAIEKHEATERIMQYLALATQNDNAIDKQRLSSVLSVYLSSTFARAGRANPMAWVRATRVEIDIAEANHADNGAWLFGRIVAQALSESVNLNDGIEIMLRLDGVLQSSHRNTLNAYGNLQ
ncbi:type VI secretion system baseplate subunit TssF [Collimonas humicola]|uniref:type VI secretion system baseplate subunit TssF n=1 Tax=Collimonas humicola TaxID=2825886 RepID=UPI001B8C40C7|nr:type VI secretion system baseplate subunit TssF [Collimonas humicola]